MATNRPGPPTQRVGLARALSKLGYCSRSRAWALIEAGKVRVNGLIIRRPEHPVDWRHARLEVEGERIEAGRMVYLMLNKPRGLVTTASDERDRDTVFQCLAGAPLPFVSPVGRLDQASEGLLLFTNDTAWANRITAPETHLEKTYHVQISGLADETMLGRLRDGAQEGGEWLRVRRAALLRRGEKNSWLELILDEGRNRHLRRLLGAFGLETLRLIRVAIGPLVLGTLPKGHWRHLQRGEVSLLSP